MTMNRKVNKREIALGLLVMAATLAIVVHDGGAWGGVCFVVFWVVLGGALAWAGVGEQR